MHDDDRFCVLEQEEAGDKLLGWPEEEPEMPEPESFSHPGGIEPWRGRASDYGLGMRFSRPVVSLVMLAGFAAGCGWSPPAPPPTSTRDCGPGPAPDAVTSELALLPPGPWRDTARGSTADCQLHWVVVTAGDQPDSPQQVLFFDGATAPVGSPTPEPRPYITVTAQGETTAVVQYQWRQGQDEPCCPTGIGSARVTLEDGRLTVLDPIPGQ